MEKSPRIVSIIQRGSGRFLDAHEIASLDFNVVTRPQQNNSTQNWIMTTEQENLVRLQQDPVDRFLDAHEIPSLDFRVVTRPRQDNNTQLWHLNLISGGKVSPFGRPAAVDSSTHTSLRRRTSRSSPARDRITTHRSGNLKIKEQVVTRLENEIL